MFEIADSNVEAKEEYGIITKNSENQIEATAKLIEK